MKRTILTLLLTGGLAAVAYADIDPTARFKWEDAEAAYAEGKYTQALSTLTEAEALLTEPHPLVLHLRIMATSELLRGSRDYNFADVERLRRDAALFLELFGSDARLSDKAREVYNITRTLGTYPADWAAFIKLKTADGTSPDALRYFEMAQRAGVEWTEPLAFLHLQALNRAAATSDYGNAQAVSALKAAVDEFNGHFGDSAPADHVAAVRTIAGNFAGVDEFQQGRRQLESADKAGARASFEAAARKGNVRAMRYLGMMYFEEKDLARSAAAFRRAAEGQDAPSMVQLGVMHKFGKGLTQDHAEAAKLFERAARLGDSNGMVFLADALEQGVGVARNYSLAKQWYQQAADKGDTLAQRYLSGAARNWLK